MSEIEVDAEKVACCGLYCAACKAYLKGKCRGCAENTKAGWCKVRSCCHDKEIASCAECSEYFDPNGCKKFNNVIAKLFGIVFRSDRGACIEQIRKIGLAGHAENMARTQRHTIRR